MSWEQVLTLLMVVEKTTGHPPLKAMRERALADLEAADVHLIGFHGAVEEEVADE